MDDDGTQPFGSNRVPYIREADFDTPEWRAAMNERYGEKREFNADLNRWIVND
jgi:hypothetical protein